MSEAPPGEDGEPGKPAAAPIISPARLIQSVRGLFDHMKLKLSRRSRSFESRSTGRRASKFTSESRGRPIRHRAATDVTASGLAFLPTVLAALVRAPGERPPRIGAADLRAWVRKGRAPLTILLIADASSSIHHFLEPAAKVLSVLYRDAYRNRDLLGLVAIQDGKVHVMNHPSRNLEVVLGNLTRLEPSGSTPLALALDRGLEVFRLEKRRQPLFHPLAVLLSDGHPEPVPRNRENMLEERPYREVVRVARSYRRERVPVVVINPAHDTFVGGEPWWGAQLGMRVASITGGKYHGIPPPRTPGAGKKLWGRKLSEDARQLRTILHDFEGRPTDSFTGEI